MHKRYDDAIVDAQSRGCEARVRELEAEVERSAQVVMGSTLKKLLPLASQHYQVFATFHDLADLRYQQPVSGPINWNTRRPQAEIELLGTHKHIDKLHYAALSLSGESLPHYGECAVLLSSKMVSHRASCLTENSAVCFHNNGSIPPGNRSGWADRARLCVVKLAKNVTLSTTSADFPELLLKAGTAGTGIDDILVEVQIFGTMTIRTFEKVRITIAQSGGKSVSKRRRKKRGQTAPEQVQDYCRTHGVDCELI